MHEARKDLTPNHRAGDSIHSNHHFFHNRVGGFTASFLVPALALFFILQSTITLTAEDRYEGILVIPSELQSGGRSAATITVFEGTTHAAAALPVNLYLVEGDNKTHLLGSGTTTDEGHLILGFDVPSLSNGVYDVKAEVDGLIDVLSAPTTLTNAPAILIETDKPIYKPGQLIHGRVLLLDNALRPASGEVEITFFDAKGIRIDRRQLTANDFGVASFDLQLASEVNFGVWKIQASSGGKDSSRDVRVENYVLPRFDLSTQFPKSWVLVSEPIIGTVRADFFFGKPVAGTVDITANRYVGVWETFATASGDLSEGEFEFTLPPVGFVSGTGAQGGLGTVTLDITVTDSTGYSQSSTEVLTVSPAETIVQIISKQDTLKPEMPAQFLAITETPDGLPRDATVSVSATIYDLWGSFLTDQSLSVTTVNGTADFSIVPPQEISRLEISAIVRTDDQISQTSLELNAAYSPSSSFLSISHSNADGTRPRDVGEEIVLNATATHPGTIFYDVYAGGRTVFSGATKTREIRFFATPEMAPSGRVVAYIINPDNEISADSLSFDVNIPAAISIATQLGKEELRPGDEVSLTIDTGQRAMVGLSIVDCSVLALGRSRLHLGEVFAELERRFMEPQAETHEDPGGEDFVDDVLGFGWEAPGARDTFESVGLSVVATAGVRIPESHEVFGFGPDVVFDADGGGGRAPADEEDGGSDDASSEVVRVRQFFPETWVWYPDILTDENGLFTMNLTVPDSITCWEVSTIGSSENGLGFGAEKATVFQEFFVEPSIPVAVTRGEEFQIGISIFNYLAQPQTVDLQFGDGDWFELLGEASLTVDVPANSAISAAFPIRPTVVGEHEVTVVAIGSLLSDAVIRVLKVEPEGHPVEEVENSVLLAGESVKLDTSLPLHAIADSGKAFLNITPSPVAQTLQGLSDLLNMPYGCGEQNMIFLAPNIEVLRYLDAIGEVMPKVRATAEHFINVGYQRELTFQTEDGGFAAFGGAEGSLWLTAFVLSTFSAARDVRDIDDNVLAQSANMLRGRQNADGSFRTDNFLIHKELDGGLNNLFAMAAYVANALADYSSTAMSDVLQKAGEYLVRERSKVNDDAYSLSIAAVALGKIAGFQDEASSLVDRLLELAVRDGIGLHWEPYPIEATSYVTMVLLQQDRPEASQAVDWISTRRNSLGGYGDSTQDTVVAIRALTEAALKIRADLDVTLTVTQGETQLADLKVDESNYDLLQSVELPVEAEDLTLQSVGTGNVSYQLVRKYHVPADFLPPSRNMTLEVIYDAKGIEVDDLVDVKVTVTYTGFKEKTGMTIVDVGIPTGFQALKATLDSLVDEEIASRVDIAGRKVIIYIDELSRNVPLQFSFQVRALYPVRAEGPLSRAYEYYDADVLANDRGPSLQVTPPQPHLFIRGDSNSDGVVDITDSVHILQFKFLGGPAPECLDRADVNDDGSVDISDPIIILRHLFLGSATPEPPFPNEGLDPTEDTLDC